MELDNWVYLVFFLVAVVYSSVGFGGGSSYLAILSTIIDEMGLIRTSAYLCNITVTFKSTAGFILKKWLDIKSAWPWLLGSIPFAFIGGSIQLERSEFFIILGFSLVFAAVVMLLKKNYKSRKINDFGKFFIGLFIGLLSGLVGIGGGIFLAPVLHIYGWKDAKSIAATSAVFILFNASAGFAGYLFRNPNFEFPLSMLFLLVSVFVGSLIGSRIIFGKPQGAWIKRITAFLVLLVGLKLLWKNLLLPFL